MGRPTAVDGGASANQLWTAAYAAAVEWSLRRRAVLLLLALVVMAGAGLVVRDLLTPQWVAHAPLSADAERPSSIGPWGWTGAALFVAGLTGLALAGLGRRGG